MTLGERRHVNTLSDLTAVILCGGHGTRLSDSIRNTPKFLAPLGGRPYADWILTMVAVEGVRDVVLCTGFMAERVEEYCQDGTRWGLKVRYSIDPWPLGTGGAVRQALRLPTSDPIAVINGDTLVRLQLESLLAEHSNRQALATILVTHQEDCARFGSVHVGPRGEVLRFGEKEEHGPGLVNAGICVVAPTALDYLTIDMAFSFERDVLRPLADGRLYAVVSSSPFVDIGTPDSYHRAQGLALRDFMAHVPRRAL